MKAKVIAAALFLAGCQSSGETVKTVTAETTVKEPVSAGFTGTWTSDWRGAIDTKLTVHSVEGGKANVTYSWAQTSFGPAGSQNIVANVSGNDLSWSSGGISFKFTERGGKLLAMRNAGGRVSRGTFVRS